MGVWGEGIFDNDSAIDFVFELLDLKEKESIKKMENIILNSSIENDIKYGSYEKILVSIYFFNKIKNYSKYKKEINKEINIFQSKINKDFHGEFTLELEMSEIKNKPKIEKFLIEKDNYINLLIYKNKSININENILLKSIKLINMFLYKESSFYKDWDGDKDVLQILKDIKNELSNGIKKEYLEDIKKIDYSEINKKDKDTICNTYEEEVENKPFFSDSEIKKIYNRGGVDLKILIKGLSLGYFDSLSEENFLKLKNITEYILKNEDKELLDLIKDRFSDFYRKRLLRLLSNIDGIFIINERGGYIIDWSGIGKF